MTFKEYMHIEKFGNTEVEGIELGQAYIFPKLDGTNASCWRVSLGNDPLCSEDWAIGAGSRTRQLAKTSDNAGFYNSILEQRPVIDFFSKHHSLRLYGEWLVPHSFKGYREDAWRRFWIFDVFNDESGEYLPYDLYKPLLDEFGLDYITPLAVVRKGNLEGFMAFLDKNFFLCPDGGAPGEGIVIKNYDFYNQFKRQCWAKLVRQEFKELNHKVMGAPEMNGKLMLEDKIVQAAVTGALVDKTQAKIKEEKGWSQRNIPELLERVFYDIIKEELWDRWKEVKFGTINGQTLRALTIQRIKELRPEIFK